MKKKLNTFLNNFDKLQFGDFILFQEYKQITLKGVNQIRVSKPIMAIYLGCFVADQTLGFNYVRWINDNHYVILNNENVTNRRVIKEVSDIESHVEWVDYINILGNWKIKPNWKEIMVAYRKIDRDEFITGDDIDWD